MSSLAFKVGDSAVYAGYGVGVITSIETREILGSKEVFYSVRIQDSEADILVPKNRTGQKGGLRRLEDRKTILKAIELLKGSELTIKKMRNWNKKTQEYMKKLKTGSLVEAACVLKDLSLLKMQKNLSFGEKQLMEQAWNLIFKEVSLVLGKEECSSLLKDTSKTVFSEKH